MNDRYQLITICPGDGDLIGYSEKVVASGTLEEMADRFESDSRILDTYRRQYANVRGAAAELVRQSFASGYRIERAPDSAVAA